MSATPELRWLVVRREVDAAKPIEVGDPVITYELDEPFPYAYMPRCVMPQDLYDYAEAVDFATATWREESALHCPNCPKGKGRKIASIMVHEGAARRWVSPRAEKLPAGFSPRPAESWPMHGERDAGPHIGEIASCPGCRKRWLVISFVDRAELIGIKSARYGAKVVE